MSWRIVRASWPGTSHAEKRKGCDDECFVEVVRAPDGEQFFVGVVSDGAGSATHGGHGAIAACGAGITVLEQWVRKASPCSNFTKEVVRGWVQSIRQRICRLAEVQGRTPRDYACTLLGAVVGLKAAVFFQVGDGAIVVWDGNDFSPVFWPDTGEYANMTFFITDEDAMAHLRMQSWCPPPDEVAMFSDGLQRLALVYKTRTAYPPFFQPMFQVLRKANAASCDRLSDQLACFLNSAKVNERTDDDKTLILATRRNSREEQDQA